MIFSRKLRPAVPIQIRQSGLGDWASDCRAQIATYSGRYVFAGSRISYRVTAQPQAHLFWDNTAKVKQLLERGPSVDVQIEVSSLADVAAFTGLAYSIQITLTSRIDRSDLSDVQTDIRKALLASGYEISGDEQIGVVSQPTPDQICGPQGGLTSAPPPGTRQGGYAQDKNPPSDEPSPFGKWFNDIQKTLGIPKEVLIIGGVVLLVVAVKGR